MSTVVGIVEDGKVYMGCDSRASNESAMRPIKTQKIFPNGPYLFGWVGSIRAGQILADIHFKPPESIDALPDAIIAHFKNRGCLLDIPEEGQIQPCNFLIGYKGKLYEIMSDFQLNEVEAYSAVGSGQYFSYGSLYTTDCDILPPIERIEIALNAAGEFDISTGPPYKIYVQDDEK